MVPIIVFLSAIFSIASSKTLGFYRSEPFIPRTDYQCILQNGYHDFMSYTSRARQGQDPLARDQTYALQRLHPQLKRIAVFSICPRYRLTGTARDEVNFLIDQTGLVCDFILDLEPECWHQDTAKNVQFFKIDLIRGFGMHRTSISGVLATPEKWRKVFGNATLGPSIRIVYEGDDQENYNDYPARGVPGYHPYAKILNKKVNVCNTTGKVMYRASSK